MLLSELSAAAINAGPTPLLVFLTLSSSFFLFLFRRALLPPERRCTRWIFSRRVRKNVRGKTARDHVYCTRISTIYTVLGEDLFNEDLHQEDSLYNLRQNANREKSKFLPRSLIVHQYPKIISESNIVNAWGGTITYACARTHVRLWRKLGTAFLDYRIWVTRLPFNRSTSSLLTTCRVSLKRSLQIVTD